MNCFKTLLPIACIALVLGSCGPEKPTDKSPAATPEQAAPPKTTPEIDYVVVKKYPHDPNSFTEGFLFHGDQLFESTAGTGYLPQTRSAFGNVDLKTGKLTIKSELDKQKFFGEGIVFLNNYVYQLTYTNQIGFVYDAKTFQKVREFGFQSQQGWGLTTDGKSLIMSDGTNYLTYLDYKDFHIEKVLGVSENGYALDYLNELEYIGGYIYANVWMKNVIVKIDPSTGEVVGKLVLDDLASESKKKDAFCLEMNGIAYDSLNNRVLVTGKMWPDIYEIKFTH